MAGQVKGLFAQKLISHIKTCSEIYRRPTSKQVLLLVYLEFRIHYVVSSGPLSISAALSYLYANSTRARIVSLLVLVIRFTLLLLLITFPTGKL